MKKLGTYYLIAGAAWWVALQVYYVSGGRPYWQGIGTFSDPNQVFGGILNAAEQVALWPWAAYQTTVMGAQAGD